MQRRRFLATLGVAGLAGCNSQGEADPTPTAGAPSSSPTAESTPTPTDTGAPTSTETPDAPEVLLVNLVGGSDPFGDVVENQIPSAPRGSEITIGWRERTWVHEGTYATTAQVEILDSRGSRVAIDLDADEQLVPGNGPQELGRRMRFHADWEPAEYTAEVIVRDDVTGKTSEPETGTFTITEPEPKLEIVLDRSYTDASGSGVRGTAQNVSDQTLAYAEVTAVFLDKQGRQIGDGADDTIDLSPGREWQFDTEFPEGEDFASYELRVDWRVA